jgi:hypothetical protein
VFGQGMFDQMLVLLYFMTFGFAQLVLFIALIGCALGLTRIVFRIPDGRELLTKSLRVAIGALVYCVACGMVMPWLLGIPP